MTPTTMKLLWAGGVAAVALTGIAIAATASGSSSKAGPVPPPPPPPGPKPQPQPGPLPGPGCPPGTTWSVPQGQCVPLGPGPQPQPTPTVDPWVDAKTALSVLILANQTLKNIGTGVLSDKVATAADFVIGDTKNIVGSPPPARPEFMAGLITDVGATSLANDDVQSFGGDDNTRTASQAVADAANTVLATVTKDSSIAAPVTPPNV